MRLSVTFRGFNLGDDGSKHPASVYRYLINVCVK